MATDVAWPGGKREWVSKPTARAEALASALVEPSSG